MGQSAHPDEPAVPRVSSARTVLIAVVALTGRSRR